MKRFWFEFDFAGYKTFPHGLIIGCGVTAFDYTDALSILKNKVFQEDLPPITKKIEDIDVSKLDQGHVIPNMRPPNIRGVWFPLGYES
jgi:hypothetical protein